ncbi:pentapeptide repeat-containing protein [Nocardia sp. NBC_01329]|uniref:pentapeptide repeat-containing protein n=1 Tax=Nocardia sp. NBC_01329 TaxID=2903594 RepID=UPI002E1135DE|nr:pentapeptide repeat-containing protein [Nocardia sp. NBC_01329]
MATTNGRTVAEVRNWPVNPIAHRALADYLSALPADPATESNPSTLLSGSGLDFTGADLSGLDLLGAELSEAILTDVKLVGSDLYTAWLTAADISRADLSRADLRKVQGRGCHAQQAVFRGADLQRADFSVAELAGADFHGARLQRVTFSGADLRRANFSGCTFERTRLSRARIHGAHVEEAEGLVIGPVDIGEGAPIVLDGLELQEWFHSNGATNVRVHPGGDPR